MDNELTLFDRLNIIRDVICKYGEDQFYISFSGGKDSTVLHHLIDEALPGNRIPRVYADTGIEYNAVKEFVKELQATDDRIEIIKPSVNIKQMLERDGYPFKSKEHSNIVRVFQNSGRGLTVNRYLSGDCRNPCPQVLRYQFSDKNTLKISDKCCRRMKKEPFNNWMKAHGKAVTMTGMMASEDGQRKRIESCIITEKDGHLKKFHPLLKARDKIKMNAKGEKHLFKCIGLLQSNAYMDVPVEPYHEKTLHDDIELVANVIHCGIDETKVIRVAMKDIEIIDDNPPLSFDDLKEGMWVWDDEEKWYMKIVFLFAPCKQYHFKGSFKVWADSCERSLDFVVFEENRFYRRQKE